MLNYPKLTNDENNFTKSQKNDNMEVKNKTLNAVNTFQKNQSKPKSMVSYPTLNNGNGIVQQLQKNSNQNENRNNIKDNFSTYKYKIPSEKLEVDRLQRLTGEYNLNKVDSKKLDDSIRLKNKTADDYYSHPSVLNENNKRLDEAFGPKTDFSISNFENNYDKFNQEEKEMIVHKMQLEFNKQGYTDKDGYKLRTDGIFGNKTKSVYEQYKKDYKQDYDDAIATKTKFETTSKPEFSTLNKTPQTNITDLKNEGIVPVSYASHNNEPNKNTKSNNYISLRKWLTNNSTPPKNGKIYYNDTTPCINGQSVDSKVKDLKYGNKNISYNGCELIAVYNALLLKNNKHDFENIIDKAEKTDKLLWLNGLWGSNPNYLDKLLEQYNQKYQKIKDSNYNKYLKEGGTYILSFWNSDSIFDGIHTVTFTVDSSKNIIVYNRYGNISKPYIYNSKNGKTGLDLLMEECGKGIVMYEITKW